MKEANWRFAKLWDLKLSSTMRSPFLEFGFLKINSILSSHIRFLILVTKFRPSKPINNTLRNLFFHSDDARIGSRGRADQAN